MARLKHTGFTLVELIVVIIIVSIVSVYAASRYFGKSSIDHVLVESELLASLRLVQLRAMHRNDYCNRWLLIGNQAAQVTANENSTSCGITIDASAQQDSSFVDASSHNVTLSLSTDTGVSYLDFDNLGRPVQCVSTQCQLSVQSASGTSRLICINPQGGIYAC